MKELIIDNFAGGGGASTGIELAIGRSVDIAINHDEAAILMHKTNHPNTKHYCENVWEVDPLVACQGRPVVLAWFSPDCKHFSKAKGGKPVEKAIRGLAWVAVKWAKTVKPRVIMLENVEEFKTWGPLLIDGKGNAYPDPKRKGETFQQFIKALQRFGYKVDYRELRACDYGAPTNRKRFFLIARCDGKPIRWPEPTHGAPNSPEVLSGTLKPWKTAAEIIDWSLPCLSIFEREKPLAENTLKRIAKGIQKFVIDNLAPFIVQVNHSKAQHHYCAAFISKYYAGNYQGSGADLNNPAPTVTAKDHNALITAFITKFYKTGIGQRADEPLHTVTTSPGHFAEVRAFLMTYYGNGEDIGQKISEPLRTVTSKDRFGIVTVAGQDYQIVDIGMRMLQPKELFRAQGFPDDYVIDRDYTGKAYSKTAQVARCGNAVPPPFAEALVRANLPELCTEELEDKNLQYLLS